ncbi:M24 family metallopeptidase [Caldicellulosiruptoraceae bacterium PP1]
MDIFNQRIQKVFNHINEVNALLLKKKENIRYFSGFKGDDSFLLLLSNSKRYLITDFRYVEQAEKEAINSIVIDYKGELHNSIKSILEQYNINTLHIEGYAFTADEFIEYKEKLSNIKIERIKENLDIFRMIKTQEEIQAIKTAVEIADRAFEYILKFIKEGVKEEDLLCELNYFFLKNGARGFSFEPIIASGERASLPHGVASNRKLKKGDFITLDFGCNFDGYMSDMTRTVFLGQPNEQQLKIYYIVKEAQERAEKEIKAGMKANEVDRIARDYIASFGYREQFGHSLGHGVGLEIHELPRLSPKSDVILEENMVVTIEPGIYIPNFGGVRIEDIVVVKKDKSEILTKSSKEVIVI